MTTTETEQQPSARYAHGPEVAARLTAWLEDERRKIAAEEVA